MTNVLALRLARPLLAAALLSSAVLAAPSLAQDSGVVAGTSPAPQTGTPAGLDALRQEFPGVLQSMQQTGAPVLTAVAPGGQIGRGKRGELVWSSLPMTADGAPVQRALRVGGDGVASPANPLVDAKLPLDASLAFAVGEGSSGFSVVPVSAADGAQEVIGDGVFHEATHTDTDTLARAVTGGIETYEILGSKAAPERFRYRIEGATPRPSAQPGVVELVSAGNVVGTVSAPVVVDAAGRPIAATLTADGDHVEFAVAHRADGVAYPVLADPLWSTDYNFANATEGVEGLFFDHEPTAGASGYDIGAENSSGPGQWDGITIRPFGGRIYQPGEVGRATFTAPAGSTITSAEFRGVYRRNDSDRQSIRLALYGGGPAVVDDYSSTLQATTDASILLTDPTASAKFAQIWMSTPPCEFGEANCPRSVADTNASRVTVQQLIVTLNDPGAPTTTLGGNIASLGPEWRQGTGGSSLDFSAADNGSGIQSWRILQRQGGAEDELASETVSCDPRHTTATQQAFVCPDVDGSNGISVQLDQLREGRIQLVGQATDFAGNLQDGSGSPLVLRLDRTPPVLDPLGGSLLAGAVNRWQQLRGTNQVTVRARDTHSGVKSADVSIAWADGADAQTVDLCQPAGSTDQPCPTDYEGQLTVDADSLPDGELSVTAKARDYVGYESSPLSAKLFKDNTNPAASARGELTDLEGEWTNSEASTGVVLEGKDRRSGVSRLELYATDAGGRRRIDDITVCDPAMIDASQPDGHCPKQVSRQASVDLGAFESGEVTLEAYATDAAGNRDPSPDSWDTYLDYDPPSAVSRISALAINASTTRVSWQPATDEGSGVAGYEYRLETADGRFTEWNTTPFPGVQIPTELETGSIEVRARDKTGNRGPRLKGKVVGYGARLRVESWVEKVLRLREGLSQHAGPIIGGFVCGEAPLCKRLDGRDSTFWLAGELLSGLVVLGDIRDVAVAVVKGDAGAGALAAAGLVPIAGDGTRGATTIRKFMKRTNLPLAKVLETVAGITGKDSAATRKLLDLVTSGGYGRLRKFDVSHEGAEQLVRSGNDIGALTRRANLARRPMTAAERATVEQNLARYWGSPRGGFRSEALGIECSVQYLKRDPDVRILVSGRPGHGLSSSGPDVVAYNVRTDRLIIVEAKGTMLSDSPLALSKIKATVNGKPYLQPSVAWLRAPRDGSRDYLKYMEESLNAQHQEAARLIKELNRGVRKQVDLKIVHVRPDRPGAQAYGPGLDTASRELKTGRVDALDLIDVPF